MLIGRDEMINIVWKPITALAGSKCFVGPYAVGGTYRRTNNDWCGSLLLPGMFIPADLNHFATEDDAKTIVAVAVEKWFDRIRPAMHAPQKSGD